MNDCFSFILVTDPHYYNNILGIEGEAYEKLTASDHKCMAETGALVDACFNELANEPVSVILIAGDLVFRGEKESHRGFIKKLEYLEKSGKKIYLITATHDYRDNPFGYTKNGPVTVEGTKREELTELYSKYGFSDAIATYGRDGLSYVAQLSEGIRLLALNSDGNTHDFKGLWDDQLEWAKEQIEDAHKSGNYIFGMMHYPLIPGNPVMALVGDAKVKNWQQTAEYLADAGLELIFTGHMHMQSLNTYTSEKGNTITDICTGALSACPAPYRKITFRDNGSIDVHSYFIKDFDWDKGGKTAQEYLEWRFKRMIDDKLYKMAYDYNGFMAYFDKPEPNKKLKAPVTAAGKLLQKLTLGSLGKRLLFKVDPSVKTKLFKDVMLEFILNMFKGDEPYTAGTPENDAVMMMLKRLRPIVHIAEKKLSKKSEALSDIPAFVNSIIGDNKKLDNNAVLDLSWNRLG